MLNSRMHGHLNKEGGWGGEGVDSFSHFAFSGCRVRGPPRRRRPRTIDIYFSRAPRTGNRNRDDMESESQFGRLTMVSRTYLSPLLLKTRYPRSHNPPRSHTLRLESHSSQDKRTRLKAVLASRLSCLTPSQATRLASLLRLCAARRRCARPAAATPPHCCCRRRFRRRGWPGHRWTRGTRGRGLGKAAMSGRQESAVSFYVQGPPRERVLRGV